MSNKKRTIYAMLAVLLIGTFIFNKAMLGSTRGNTVVRKAKRLPAGVQVPQELSAAEKAATPGARGVSPEAVDVQPEFARWFSMEAQRIQAREIDSLATEEELKKQASSFGPREVNYLAHRASSALVPAGERILASYLLGLAAEKSSQALVDIASRPVENAGPHEVHSIGEKKAAQERAFKIMAVDAIYNSGSDISQKIDKLQAIVNQSPDGTVKKYASDKVDDLKNVY